MSAFNFELVASPAATGSNIANASATSGGRAATLTLAYTGGALSGKVSLRALAAAYSGTANITSKALTVQPAPPEIVLSRSTLAVTEESRGTYGVRLNKPPTGTVVVSVSSAGTAVSAAPASLTYNATSWNTAQTVTEPAASTVRLNTRPTGAQTVTWG